MIWLFCAAFITAPARGQDVPQDVQGEMQPKVQQQEGDPISSVKLKADTLPDGFEITAEVRATKSQLYKTRQKIGFPLTALHNQKISYEGHQARVNYMALPKEEWVNFGYSKLMQSEGYKGMIMVKDGVLIQMVTSTKELEDWLILLLGIDRLQTHKIRRHRIPPGWTFEGEGFLVPEDIGKMERESRGTIRQGLQQEIIVGRTAVRILYLDCITQKSADLVGRNRSRKGNVLEKRLVKGYGPIVVVVDSGSDDLNRQILTHMNW
jgi:hypothetical protein